MEPAAKRARTSAVPPVPAFQDGAAIKEEQSDAARSGASQERLLTWDPALFKRWAAIPRMGGVVANSPFIPLKLPLSTLYEDQYDEASTFTPLMFLERQIQQNRNIGLVIDASGLGCYLHPSSEWEDWDVSIVRLPVEAQQNQDPFAILPGEASVNAFIAAVTKFREEDPSRLIAVFCADGIHRTGILICSFLVMQRIYNLEQALEAFAKARPPGLYRSKFVNHLYQRFKANPKYICPPPPAWDLDPPPYSPTTVSSSNATPSNGPSIVHTKPSSTSTSDSRSVVPTPLDALPFGEAIPSSDLNRLRSVAFTFVLGLEQNQFKPSVPTPLTSAVIDRLKTGYFVTWNPAGTRSLVLIMKQDVFLLDEKFRAAKKVSIRFPHRKSLADMIDGTLLDGIFVLDRDPQTQVSIWRYLCTDVIAFSGRYVGGQPLASRIQIIVNEIINPRKQDASGNKNYDYNAEPFRIRLKDNFKMKKTEYMLRQFLPNLTHSNDGLVFVSTTLPYAADSMLFLWKPSSNESEEYVGEADLLSFIQQNNLE